MKNHNTKKTATSLKNFITANKICLLHAKGVSSLEFNKYLKKQLSGRYQAEIAFASVDLSNLKYNDPFLQEILQVWIPKLGLSKTATLLPGYYLFKQGLLIAFHPGTLDPERIDPKVDGITTLLSLVAGFVVGFAERNAAKGLYTFLEATYLSIGLKMFHFFNTAINNSNPYSSRVHQRLIFETELDKAYKLLGISSEALDEEVHKAWKKILKEVHPDVSLKDKEAHTQLTAEINNAHDLIMASRKSRHKQTVS